MGGRPDAGAPAPGLRERNKRQKHQRIRAAAGDLFTRRGYEATTMRQIAQRAHVGLGTLFNYADDKRDLVFLIFNDELAALTDTALRAPRPDARKGVADLRRLLELQFNGLRPRRTRGR